MATLRGQVYKCPVCGIIAVILDGGAGEPVCCGQPMRLLAENSGDASPEKHVPLIEHTDAGIRVTVGSVPHPMEARHLIEWIEITADTMVCRQHLRPGEAPEAFFPIRARDVTVREYCNLHGLWKA